MGDADIERGTDEAVEAHLRALRRGLTWEAFGARFTFVTEARTIRESDLASFVNLAGFAESLFLDAERPRSLGYEGALVPAALTYSIAEGLVVQSGLLRGTAMALLGTELKVIAPVSVGDTIRVEISSDEVRPASHNRGVVTTQNVVRNQHGASVLEYRPMRMIDGARDLSPEDLIDRSGAAL